MATLSMLHEAHVMELPRKPRDRRPSNGPALALVPGTQLTLRDVHALNSPGVREVIIYRNYVYRWGDLANQLRTLVDLALARLEGGVTQEELERARLVADQALNHCRVPVTGDKILGRLRSCPALEQELEASLLPYRLGRLRAWTHAERWSDIRTDVLRLARQLAQVSPAGYQLEYLTLLRRWLKRFRHADPEPEEAPRGFDPNRLVFPLPADVARNPCVLREWIETWRPFDCDVPQQGSWETLGKKDGDGSRGDAAKGDKGEVDDVDEVFKTSLRPWVEDAAFDTDVEGDVAWPVLPEDVVYFDATTPRQELTAASRRKRASFGDPAAMKARRRKLRRYFQKKYHFSEEKLDVFSNWADNMEKNMQQLQALCD